MRKPRIPWKKALLAGDFISAQPSYPCGEHLDLFEDRLFVGCDDAVGAIRYYVYDPTKHGMPSDRTYPVLFALHGMGGSNVGKLAINWASAEMFATPEYQRRLGGAYIVVPLANENPDDSMSWMTPMPGGGADGYTPEALGAIRRFERYWQKMIQMLGVDSVYTESLLRVLAEARASFASAGGTVLMGTSAGGYAAWRMLLREPEAYAAAIIMAGAYLPSAAELARLRHARTPLMLCHGLYDEIVPFDLIVGTNLPLLAQMPNVDCYFPRLVRNGDHGVASNPVGDTEMGQHCINNEISQNLLFDDGTPYDPRFPDGATGWIQRHAGV